jgi:hypothetical protein
VHFLVQAAALVGFEHFAAVAAPETLQRHPYDAAKEGMLAGIVGGRGGGGGGGGGGSRTVFLLVLSPALSRGQAPATLYTIIVKKKFLK